MMKDWRDQYIDNPRKLVTIRNNDLHRLLTDTLGIEMFRTIVGDNQSTLDWRDDIVFIDDIKRRMFELQYPEDDDPYEYIEQRNAARDSVKILQAALDLGAVSAIVLPE